MLLLNDIVKSCEHARPGVKIIGGMPGPPACLFGQHVMASQARELSNAEGLNGSHHGQHPETPACCLQNQSAQFVPISPVQREHLRQAQFASALDVMDDINGGDDKTSNKAMIPNGKGTTSSSGIMSYHGGKIVSQPLSVYLIM